MINYPIEELDEEPEDEYEFNGLENRRYNPNTLPMILNKKTGRWEVNNTPYVSEKAREMYEKMPKREQNERGIGGLIKGIIAVTLAGVIAFAGLRSCSNYTDSASAKEHHYTESSKGK